MVEWDLGLTQCQVKEQVAGGRYIGGSSSLLAGGQTVFTLKSRFEKIIDQHSTFYVNSYIHIIHVLMLLLG